MRLIPGQHIHLIGIGGFGLSAIARVLLQQGYFVSGSDKALNSRTKALADEGAMIFAGHQPEHVAGAELVIVSSAVPENHVELTAAQAKGIPIYKRSDIIADIIEGQQCIAVAGTHGKTTTTAMLAHILLETDNDPSYIVGGFLRNTNTNASLGGGDTFVIEADEYDNMFHGLRPNVAILTNIEFDHPDFFETPNDVVESFRRFVALLPNDGLLVACMDDPTAAIFANNRFITEFPVETYGIKNPQAQWSAEQISVDKDGNTTFEVDHNGELAGIVRLPMSGEHNVRNAIAAIIAAHSQGVPFKDAATALETFQGTGRRFEIRGEAGGVTVVNDYAHHPTAIRATLAAARQRFPKQEVWAIWQPHTFTRTKALQEQFITAFEDADHVLVVEIYAARELPIPGVTSQKLWRLIRNEHYDVRHAPLNDFATAMLVADVKDPAVVVILSAGDAYVIGDAYLSVRQQRLKQAQEDLRQSNERTVKIDRDELQRRFEERRTQEPPRDPE